jgi:16S rRNA (uracil1498-N3)-methyltransferase
MQQYFTDKTLKIGESIELDSEASRHQLIVLRAKEGDCFRMADAKGQLYLAELAIKSTKASAMILKSIPENNEMRLNVTIIQALIKGERWDYFLQKATECGATRIVPFLSERNVVKYDKKTDSKKLERWRKIVREAAEQSRRNIIPEVTSPISADELVNYLSETNFVAYEGESNGSMQLKDLAVDTMDASVLIGCEGGFSPREIQRFISLGFKPVGLGRRILRAETAALVALTLLEGKTPNQP